MNAQEFSKAMSEIQDKYYEEAAGYSSKKGRWVKWSGMAACLAAAALAVHLILPRNARQPVNTPSNPSGAAIPGQSGADTVPLPTPSAEACISMDRIFFNDVGILADAARVWRDPERYDSLSWGNAEILDYYGKDLTPPYIPDGLIPAGSNGTATVIADREGAIVEDTVWLGFYHAYYDDGSPMLTEGVSAVKGFSVRMSKIGLLNDCFYITPEKEAKTSDINGTAVTFGCRSMPYGPYDPETHEPSGYYDLYVAEFEKDGIEYQVVAEQISKSELVKVVSSILYGREVTVSG